MSQISSAVLRLTVFELQHGLAMGRGGLIVERVRARYEYCLSLPVHCCARCVYALLISRFSQVITP